METNVLADILVDTSVWIEFFRKHEPYHAVVSRLIDDQRIVCTGLILAELLQGAKTEKELTVLDDFIQVFPFLPETPQLWAAAGRLAFTLRRQGLTIGLADCFIATIAGAAGTQVATLDNHFKELALPAKINLFSFA